MKADIIIGANLGDEGKGTVVATCAKHAEGKVLNILTNGGSQRAHSILTDVGNFTFQHFGTGTYHGAYNYFSKYFIINPMQFTKEHRELLSRGVDPIVYRDSMCRWSTPFDMIANAIIESLRGSNKHGSCGMGIWETTLRYKTIQTSDFGSFLKMAEETQINYLLSIKKYYEEQRIKTAIPLEWKSIWDNLNLLYNFIDDCRYLERNSIEINGINNIDINSFSNLIFENGQGLLLSDTGKDIAGTTPSLTGCNYAGAIINELDKITRNKLEVNLHYVSRPYLTRHGRGYLDREKERVYISSDLKEDRTNHYNEFQENFRYGEMSNDVMSDMFKYIMKDAAQISHDNIILDLTHCDEIDKEAEFKKIFNNVVTYDSPLIK